MRIPNPDPGPAQYKRVNRDEIRSTGLELLGSWALDPVVFAGDLTLQGHPHPSMNAHRTRHAMESTPIRCTLAALSLMFVPAVTAAAQEAAAQAPDGAAESAGVLTQALLEPFELRFIGPANMSGRVTAFGVPDAAGRKTMYAALASGGVWKTTNRGTTWRPIFEDGNFGAVADVAVAPSDHDVVWLGTGERNSLRSNGWGDGVYKSTDGGSSWEHMGLVETREIGRVVIHPDDPDIVYVAAMGHLWDANPERGVYKTVDGGASWEKVLFANDTVGFVDLKMDPRDPDVLYAAGWHRLRWGGGRMEGAGAGSGIWKTTDGGTTWTELTAPGAAGATDGASAGADASAYNARGLPTRKLGRIGLGVAPSDPDVVYAVVQAAHGAKNASISPYGGVFRSADAGASWTRVNDLSAVPDYYYNEIWVDPNDADHFYLGQTILQESEDGGESIAPVRMDRVHVDHHAMWIDPADSEHIVLGNDGGVYITHDGGESWAHQIIPASQFYEVDVDTTKVPYHVCGGTQDNGTWCGPSRTRERAGITNGDWYGVHGGDGFHSAVSPDSPSVRYGESQYGNINRLDVDAWEYASITPHAEDAGAESGYSFRWDWNSPLMVSMHDPSVLYVGGNHLFRMTDRGRDWEILGPDMTRQNRFRPEPDTGHTAYHSLHAIAESALDRNTIWTGSNDGLVWVTTDGGETWRNVTANIAAAAPADSPPGSPERCFAAEIEASARDAATAYVAYDCHRRDDYHPYVFHTTDNGESWTDISGDLPDDAGSYVIREDPVNPDLLFIGNQRGLYLSIHGGGDWIRVDNDLPTVAVRDMEIVPRRKELVVGTYGRSIYVLDIGPLEELTDEVLAFDGHLFGVKPARTYNRRDTYGSFGQEFFTASNPPYGTAITYYLREDQGDDVQITIRRAPESDAADVTDVTTAADAQADGDDGTMAFSGETSDNTLEAGKGEVVKTLTGSGRPGMHRITWDLTRDSPRPHRLGDPAGGFGGGPREVLPGTFTIELTVGGETFNREVTVEEGWIERMPGRVR